MPPEGAFLCRFNLYRYHDIFHTDLICHFYAMIAPRIGTPEPRMLQMDRPLCIAKITKEIQAMNTAGHWAGTFAEASLDPKARTQNTPIRQTKDPDEDWTRLFF
jgi:hypothetical protein